MLDYKLFKFKYDKITVSNNCHVSDSLISFVFFCVIFLWKWTKGSWIKNSLTSFYKAYLLAGSFHGDNFSLPLNEFVNLLVRQYDYRVHLHFVIYESLIMSSTGKRRSNVRRALAPPTSAKRQKKTTPISSDETPAPDVSFAHPTNTHQLTSSVARRTAQYCDVIIIIILNENWIYFWEVKL